jgi:hypothetical protein
MIGRLGFDCLSVNSDRSLHESAIDRQIWLRGVVAGARDRRGCRPRAAASPKSGGRRHHSMEAGERIIPAPRNADRGYVG